MPTIIFKNDNEIKKYYDKICKNAINSVSQKLLKDFQDHLDKTIYSIKPGEYKRYRDKGGFYSGWVINDEKWDFLGKYVKNLVFDSNKLVPYIDDNRNGNIAHGGRGNDDIRDMMPFVLNSQIQNDYLSVAGGSKYVQNNSTGYWDTYLVDLDKKILKWFDEELNKYGIKRKRG